ncbi:SHOCT domain-containing protein [Conexibacter sp. CPCC 206217]|uniref:SHOCT domain-containing protein n=1 Tax=Conexibacter sp. CPCC 206217 TaxID=3064574 RepID=UPI00271D0B32|nr:SHOCT domain-containing protein [Conexibacter sp. CPCC 206217]MDO8213831.1 SHOCT domain-containing protein [Conexibacter sp. CPCC 206217]
MRAAMMGGAGYMAGKRAARSSYRESDQEQRLEQLEQQQAAPAAPAPVAAPAPAAAPAGGDLVTKLNELKGLLDAGALTQAEFDAAKAKVLQGA